MDIDKLINGLPSRTRISTPLRNFDLYPLVDALKFLLEEKKKEVPTQEKSVEFTSAEINCIKAVFYYGFIEKVVESYRDDIASIDKKLNISSNGVEKEQLLTTLEKEYLVEILTNKLSHLTAEVDRIRACMIKDLIQKIQSL